MFSIGSAPRLYSEHELGDLWRDRVEAGTNTSTVTLRVVGGDEKGPQCLGYNWVTMFQGNLNTGPGPPGWVSLESVTVKYGHE
jgi:hypothetical protein